MEVEFTVDTAFDGDLAMPAMWPGVLRHSH